VSTPRDELRELVERLPDEQVPAAVSDLKARLTDVGRGRQWPPAWFAVAEGSAPDVSERVEEILAEGLGRRPA
jgi:hypothetical protein